VRTRPRLEPVYRGWTDATETRPIVRTRSASSARGQAGVRPALGPGARSRCQRRRRRRRRRQRRRRASQFKRVVSAACFESCSGLSTKVRRIYLRACSDCVASRRSARARVLGPQESARSAECAGPLGRARRAPETTA